MPGSQDSSAATVAAREALHAEISRLQAEVQLTREVLEHVSARLDELECEEAVSRVCEELTASELSDE